ncbi:BON domain-containing protein [Caballeronia sp. GAFFF1]|uniref:BON domain-containing protein n=1 Tax=Caballeronia sp. GAFFF1 TaxID=2921779 RepID=UPI0020283946|nr:BON domain-containing protein [Caballeronia sp. GAFFF1]
MGYSLTRYIVLVLVASLLNMAGAHAQTSAGDASQAPTNRSVARKQNHQLESKVRHALAATKHLDSSGIVVVARGGKVTLDGDAPDDGQIQMAEDATTKVSGVSDVKNNIHVREAGH